MLKTQRYLLLLFSNGIDIDHYFAQEETYSILNIFEWNTLANNEWSQWQTFTWCELMNTGKENTFFKKNLQVKQAKKWKN